LKGVKMAEGKVLALETSYLTNILSKATDWEDFIGLWMQSKEFEQAVQWFKGDIATKIEIRFGQSSLSKFAQEVGENLKTIEAYRRVSRAFPKMEDRLWNLAWTHYFLASQTDAWDKKNQQFPTNNRFKWIKQAHDNSWGTVRLAVEIQSNNALVQKTANEFNLYLSYVSKFVNMITHWDLKSLSEPERKVLCDEIFKGYSAFAGKIKGA